MSKFCLLRQIEGKQGWWDDPQWGVAQNAKTRMVWARRHWRSQQSLKNARARGLEPVNRTYGHLPPKAAVLKYDRYIERLRKGVP